MMKFTLLPQRAFSAFRRLVMGRNCAVSAASEHVSPSNDQACDEPAHETPTSLTRKVFQDPSFFIAFGFGTGLMPKAPGTFGTFAAIPIYLLLAPTPWYVYLTVTILAFFLGIYVSNQVSRALKLHDYQGIVWDEVVGLLLTLFLAPKGLGWIITGFILFRLFDIWKPEPIRWVDKRVPGGFGIMLDDVLAAIPAFFILQLLVLGMRA